MVEFQPIWKNMRKSKWVRIFPKFRDEHKKIFELPPSSDIRHCFKSRSIWIFDLFFWIFSFLRLKIRLITTTCYLEKNTAKNYGEQTFAIINSLAGFLKPSNNTWSTMVIVVVPCGSGGGTPFLTWPWKMAEINNTWGVILTTHILSGDHPI